MALSGLIALLTGAAPSGGRCSGRGESHRALCLRSEAPQKRNNLLEFLWFGKKPGACSQLLEELRREIVQGLPAADSRQFSAASPGME